MFVTRRAEFSASHVCRVPGLSEAENRELFGDGANRNGHGHNYIVQVTVAGDPDPVSGMVIDLKDLKDLLEREVVEPMDHRFLNYEVPPFDRVVPTAENVAREIWRRLEPHLATATTRLARVRLFETEDLYVDVTASASALGNGPA
jgi:6-pyruvoyltetrahydropterin/6-carboxytetrahydropterin synthase